MYLRGFLTPPLGAAVRNVNGRISNNVGVFARDPKLRRSATEKSLARN